jgi:hypothetical protein
MTAAVARTEGEEGEKEVLRTSILNGSMATKHSVVLVNLRKCGGGG